MSVADIARKIEERQRINSADIERLYHDASSAELSRLATLVRDRIHTPGQASYIIMAIVNYTNICVAKCDYCSFYRLPHQDGTYLLTFEQVAQKVAELKEFGGQLVGFNGGFHPKLRIHDYAELFSGIRERFPDIEFYEMTVAEFMFSCKVSRISYDEGARILADSGTRWVTGGGAEILEDGFRDRHSPGKYKVHDYYAAQEAVLNAGLGSTATMVIGFDETLEERIRHLETLRDFQDRMQGGLASFLCWTYKPWNNELGGQEIPTEEYLRWLAISRLYLDNFRHIRTSVLTKNEEAMHGLKFGADDFDLPTEDEVTQKAGATISHDFEQILEHARKVGYEPCKRGPLPQRPGRVGHATRAGTTRPAEAPINA